MDKPRFYVKVELPNGNLHKFSIIPSLSFNALHSHLLEISGLAAVTVTYLDEEGDKVTLTNEEEFVEAKRALDIGSIASLSLALSADTSVKPVERNEADKPRPTPRISTRKVGHYPELAEEVGEMVHGGAPKELEAASKNTQTTPEMNNVITTVVSSNRRSGNALSKYFRGLCNSRKYKTINFPDLRCTLGQQKYFTRTVLRENYFALNFPYLCSFSCNPIYSRRALSSGRSRLLATRQERYLTF